MKKLWIPLCLLLFTAMAYGDISDTAWNALVKKSVVIVKTDGSEVSGELSAVDSTQVVIIKQDGEAVVVERKDVKTVRVQTAAGGSAAAASTQPSQSTQPSTQPSQSAQPAAAKPPTTPSHHIVMLFNPIGNVISSIALGGVDVTLDLQFALSKSLVVGVEPEVAVGYIIGGGAWGGILWFPLNTAPEGLFIKAYAGAGYFGSIIPEAMAAVGYQFIWGGFVFSPDIGVQYYGSIGFHWRLNVGFAL